MNSTITKEVTKFCKNKSRKTTNTTENARTNAKAAGSDRRQDITYYSTINGQMELYAHILAQTWYE